MPKHLVTALGLALSLGVIALGVFLVALPLYFQAVSVDDQTATVAQANTVYQAQLDSLREQEQNIDQINASVEGLRSQIPATGQLDDVFEVVGNAALASGVALNQITAGGQAAFVTRTSATGSDTAADSGSASATGRQQVDFTIRATATDMAQATAFLDALRAGPRLLSSMAATSTQSGAGTIDIQISALTYVDAEG